jgi:cell wall-associated NlpC family hydrolase
MNSAIAFALISLFPLGNLAPLQSAANFTIAANPTNIGGLVVNQTQPEIADYDNGQELVSLGTSNQEVDPKFTQIIAVAIAQDLHQKSYGEIVQSMAEQLTGSGYREGLLDRSPQEELVISLTQFDCVLLVETVLALAMGVAVEDYTYPNLAENVQSLRYSDGEIDGYCSRLHYFSDWINDNQKRGQVIEIGDRLGGVPLDKPLRFMSNHWQLYPKLLGNKANRDCITAMEKGINTQQISYVPTDKIRAAYAQLQPGDIIAIATSIEGLDVTHTGLAYQHSDGNTSQSTSRHSQLPFRSRLSIDQGQER